MKYYVDVVNLNSFTKAAEVNYIAQTAISHSVAKIEKHYGDKLLIRNRGSIKPTKSGEIVYKEFVSILDIHNNSMQKVNKIKDLERSKKVISIGFIDYFEMTDFDRKLKALQKNFKEYDFRIVDKYSVKEKYADIEIGYDFEFTRNSTFVDGKMLSMNLLVNKNHRLADNEKVYLEDIRNEILYILCRKRSIGKIDFNKYISQDLIHNEDNIRYVYSALERRSLVECEKGVALIEDNMFHYNKEKCKIISLVGKDKRAQNLKIKYCINYKDKNLRKIAEFLYSNILL